MKREIYFTPAFDRRDPNPSENFGVHGVEMRWYVIGKAGAVQFVLNTNWHLPHVMEEFKEKRSDYYYLIPMPADVGYHSPKPMYIGQHALVESCELLNGEPCYYDGSGLTAERYFDILVKRGGEALWEELEKYYKDIFGEE
jgi:hypothetical protein